MAAHRTDRWHTMSFVSEALRGNPLGDPHERPLHVYVPADTSRRYPSVYVIQGMTGMADAWFNVEPWTLSYPDRIDALAPEAVVVLVDAFTAVGGSQYVDSPAIGHYHTYLCDEIVPYVDAHFPTLAAREHRGIQGKSSGGYGSMITPLLRPDLFGGLATHAGDALFEVCYARDFAPAARALRDAVRRLVRRVLGGLPLGPARALVAVRRAARQHVRDVRRLLVERRRLGRPAVRHRDRRASIPRSGQRWLRFDPVLLAREPGTPRRCATCARSGSTRVATTSTTSTSVRSRSTARSSRPGTRPTRVHFELFPGTHRGLTWRYPLSLALPRRAVSRAPCSSARAKPNRR